MLCNAAAHDTTLASHQSMMLTAQVLQIFDTIESELALKDIVITQTPERYSYNTDPRSNSSQTHQTSPFMGYQNGTTNAEPCICCSKMCPTPHL